MMFCYQCQEAFKGKGCTERGVCGKDAMTSNIMDLLIYTVKGVSTLTTLMRDNNIMVADRYNHYVINSLYATSSNCNYNREMLKRLISDGISLKRELIDICRGMNLPIPTEDEVSWCGGINDFTTKAASLSITEREPDSEQRNLKEFILYSLKGVACFMYHIMRMGEDDLGVHTFMQSVLSDMTKKSISEDEWMDLIQLTGQYTMRILALYDQRCCELFGYPELSTVNLSTRNRAAILVSGSSLTDLKELLAQSEGEGIDIYTHNDLISAHSYPVLKRFSHLAGNYGSSWRLQREEFPAFHGPILFTSEAIIPPSIEFSYKERIFTTNMTGYPGCRHINCNKAGKKDFSDLITTAKEYRAPANLERGSVKVGFGHNSLSEISSQIMSAMGLGYIKRFVVIVGEDGRSTTREYYTQLAGELPTSCILFTAGSIKYRFFKQRFGYMNGIPRIYDAGQLNDTYSLIKFFIELKNALHQHDINDLPIDYFVSWYDQKSIAVLLALLAIGIKGIKLGPTSPPFCSERMMEKLRQHFNLKLISTPELDIRPIYQKLNSEPIEV
ncbi:MAG: hydroxylamine reductase [Marinifilaceae bacterium]|nr:hydroxylamine reductase [Marinifilaceae bacterium]